MNTPKDDSVSPSRPESAANSTPYASSPKPEPSAAPALNIGSVLSRTLATLGKNPGVFFGLALAAVVPSFILMLLLPPDWASGTKIVDMVFGLAVQGATAYAVFQVLRGNVASMSESITRGMARLGPLAIAALLTGLGTAVGMVFFIVPGLILLCLWSVTIPACVVEHLGPIESMKRSADLTRGYRMTIFALFLITYLCIILVSIVIGYTVVMTMDSTLVAGILMALVLAVPQAFNNVMVAIVYYDLRAIKDGVTIDSLVNVFD